MTKLILDEAESGQYLKFKQKKEAMNEIVSEEQYIDKMIIIMLSIIFGVLLGMLLATLIHMNGG